MALSSKPRPGTFKPGTKPLPLQSDFALEDEITSTAKAVREVNEFNDRILSWTQPYDGAARFREGNLFPQRQRQMIQDERFGLEEGFPVEA